MLTRRISRLFVVPALTWALALGCAEPNEDSSEADGDESTSETGDGDPVGDGDSGDGDPGDGDGDPGDGDGDPGDGDGDPGDGDGDPGDGDGDPGDGDGDPGDGDGDPGDGDGDPGDGDGLPDIPPDDNPSSARHTPIPLGTTEAGNGYWEYLPPGYGEGQLYPLLVFWHGIGENGNGDSELDKVLAHGPPKLINQDQWPNERPFVVLSAQHGGGGCPSADEIEAFIAYAMTSYDINPDRVYLTGLSCGAIGTWSYLGKYVDSQIAALVPVAGNGNGAWNQQGCELGSVPIWAFHGGNDQTVPPNGTIDPITNLQACDPPAPADMIIYEGVGHDSWTMTYNLSAGHDIYAWMLEQSK